MRTILVALDGSPFAEAAIPVAVALARTIDAGIDLVTVHEPPPGVHAISGAMVHDLSFDRRRHADLRAALEASLQAAVVRTVQAPDAPPVTGTMLEGRPTERLLEHATTIGADAIVLTTHGRGGISRAWLGSVMDQLIRQSSVPVVSVRPTERQDALASTDSDSTSRIKRVLVTFDGSRNGWSVVAPIHALFGDRVEYVLFRAIAPLHPLLEALASDAAYQRDLEEQRAEAMRYLQVTLRHLESRGLHASICTRTELVPSRAICACGKENDIDMIAIARRGLGFAGRMMLGSVADKVTRTADLPVISYLLDTDDA